MLGVLHGTWRADLTLNGNFIIWVERVPNIQETTQKVKKKTNPPKLKVSPLIHPYCAIENDLLELFDQLIANIDQSEVFQKNRTISQLELLFPTSNNTPIPSPELTELAKLSQGIEIPFDVSQAKPEWWAIPVLSLPIEESYHFFHQLESSISDIKHLIRLGQDVRYWLQVFAFFEDLLQLQSFLPTIWIDETKAIFSYWRAVPQCHELRSYWKKLLKQMPYICNCYRDEKNPALLFPLDELVQSFLDAFLQLEINNQLNPDLIKTTFKFPRTGKRQPKALAKIWLTRLYNHSNQIVNPGDLEILHSLGNYIAKGISSLDTPEQVTSSQVYFQLEPPDLHANALETSDHQNTPWILSFWLQSRDDPSLRIPARFIWKSKEKEISYLNQQFSNPQEVLLTGLGKAMRIFPPIRRSLMTKNPESCSLTFSEAITFLQEISLSLSSAGFGVMIPRGSSKSAIIRPSVKASLTPHSQGIISSTRILNFQWEIAIGDEVLTEEEINLLATLKTSLVSLRGKWVEVNPVEIERTLNYWKKRGKNAVLPISEVIRLAANPKDPNLGLPIQKLSLPEWFEKLLTDRKEFVLLDPPATLNAELRPYQLQGVSWINFMHSLGLNPCLADDMGLGKTIQAITVMLLLKVQLQSQIPQNSQKKGKREKKISEKRLQMLVICPTSVITNWGKELTQFAPSLRWKAYHGPNREEILEEKLDVMITSYGLIRRDLERLKDQHWDLLIIDEAQNIKNPYSDQSKAVRLLNATSKIALTGTPIENRVAEFWPLFDFLNPNYLGNFKHFQRYFVRPIELYQDEMVTQQLLQLVKPFLLRRSKQDKKVISDLPDKFETKNYCNLTKEQVTLYQSIVNQQLKLVESAEGISRRGAILATLLKLKQVCNHPSHFLGDQGKIEGRSGKLQRVLELIDEIVKAGDAVLIFTQFVQMGEILKKFLNLRLQQEILFLHGRMTRIKRDKIINLFQESKNLPQIMILSLKAGGTGLNLTRASHVIHFDRWWNPAVENQATDRAYRIGQKKNVQVHKLITVGTVEEHIDELIEKKTSLAKTFTGSGEEALTSLSNEEFTNLITLSQEIQILDEDY